MADTFFKSNEIYHKSHPVPRLDNKKHRFWISWPWANYEA